MANLLEIKSCPIVTGASASNDMKVLLPTPVNPKTRIAALSGLTKRQMLAEAWLQICLTVACYAGPDFAVRLLQQFEKPAVLHSDPSHTLLLC